MLSEYPPAAGMRFKFFNRRLSTSFCWITGCRGEGLFWIKHILAQYPQVAIITVTGQESEKIAVESLKSGAMDYLVKGSITPEGSLSHRPISVRLPRKPYIQRATHPGHYAEKD
jgi:hypothetical protein